MSDMKHEATSATDPCSGCAVIARRDFLRTAGLMAAGTLVALGASPAIAAAAPMEFVTARGGCARRKDVSRSGQGRHADRQGQRRDDHALAGQGVRLRPGLPAPEHGAALVREGHRSSSAPSTTRASTPDGVYIKDSGRATRGLDRFAVRKDGNNVVVNLDKLYQEDEDEAAWKTAFVTV